MHSTTLTWCDPHTRMGSRWNLTREELERGRDHLREVCGRLGIRVRTRDVRGRFYVTLVDVDRRCTRSFMHGLVVGVFPTAYVTSSSDWPRASVTMRINPRGA